ncbi:MAG: hypothetical protein KatS3mg096_792 [Candidatus Parcubacteria bacterium]|nr:MAG: hypothetical protein KatS3mg096_792 [Candidatus Parcubacteria bacterium]
MQKEIKIKLEELFGLMMTKPPFDKMEMPSMDVFPIKEILELFEQREKEILEEKNKEIKELSDTMEAMESSLLNRLKSLEESYEELGKAYYNLGDNFSRIDF